MSIHTALFEPINKCCLFLVVLIICSNCSADHNKYVEPATESPEKPEESRFEKVTLEQPLDEPIELDVFPDGRVLFVERHGDVHLHFPDRKKTRLIAELDVTSIFSHGLLGITLDPDFEEKKWVYLYYSPETDEDQIQRLSRFRFQENDLLLGTEQVILEVPVQRKYHGHDGGSLAFGPDGNLFVAVGDNTSPFMHDTRYPMDERPGKKYFDAQRTSLNTNNLNGKILRIRPAPGGGYTVPDGNLFPEGMPQTKPEIYVMGVRNPYRISVDPETGYLYFANMGGVDELHQVREPGLYGGWPYFYGKRQPYKHAVRMKEESLNPEAPRNTSPNHTGRTQLPPVHPAILWYDQKAFPRLKEGEARAYMAGPVFRSDRYPDSNRKFPDYYDGKLFFYDWMKSWIMTVRFDENHEYKGMEPFLPSTTFARPIDMEFGPKGALYLLEYGSSSYSSSPDARLARIDYIRGNRPPEASVTVTPKYGGDPLKVRLSATDSFDYDEGDVLQYDWRVSSSNEMNVQGDRATITFQNAGTYTVRLRVTDSSGATDTATTNVRVGNEPPDVNIEVKGNRSFYWDDRKLVYAVRVRDKEDGTVSDGIDPESVSVNLTYKAHHAVSASPSGNDSTGRNLFASSDCGSCHKRKDDSVGPSLVEISERYRSTVPLKHLTRKVIEGGGGNWKNSGNMPSHTSLSRKEVKTIVKYILSVNRKEERTKSLPLKGARSLTAHRSRKGNGTYELSASYTDRGSKKIGPLTATEKVVLRPPFIEAETYDHARGKVRARNMYLDQIQHNSYIAFESIDLTDFKRVTYRVEPKEVDGTIEVHLGDPDGKLISKARVEGTGTSRHWREELYTTTSRRWTRVSAPLEPTDAIHDLYFVFKNQAAGKKKLLNLDWIRFQR